MPFQDVCMQHTTSCIYNIFYKLSPHPLLQGLITNILMSCWSLLLICFFLVNSVASSIPPPGKVLDLSTFDALQIPVDDGKGGMTQIRHPKLDTYTSDYFYTNPQDTTEVVFWAPENGVVSGNGAGPRTELTEENNLFTFSGIHTMKYSMKVKQVPSGGKVCIGQIKGDSCDSCRALDEIKNSTVLKGSSCLIVVELIYDETKNGLVSAKMRDKNCNSVSFDLGKFKLDEDINISLKVDGYNVYVSSNKQVLEKYDYSFWKGSHYGMHFKVGLYDQNSSGKSSSGGQAKLSNLKITHD
jgi:hypothetical protein